MAALRKILFCTQLDIAPIPINTLDKGESTSAAPLPPKCCQCVHDSHLGESTELFLAQAFWLLAWRQTPRRSPKAGWRPSR